LYLVIFPFWAFSPCFVFITSLEVLQYFPWQVESKELS
jgi:hypothetical protein